MSTRGLMAVRVDGIDKGGYNHSDSYPEGLGVSVLTDLKIMLGYKNKKANWLTSVYPAKLKTLRSLAKALEVITNASEEQRPTQAHLERFAKFANPHVGGPVNNTEVQSYYQLLRGLQGELQKTLKAGLVVDSMKFITDSLFCEWAYIVNLDSEELEVYKGFQQHAHKLGRYANFKPEPVSHRNPYYACALIETFPLKKLPTAKAFAKACKAHDKE